VHIGVTVTPAPSRPPGSGSDARLGLAAKAMAPRLLRAPDGVASLAMLRPGLLAGTVVATAGGAEAIAAACADLGATTVALTADLGDEEAVQGEARRLGAVGTLVCDAGAPFAAAGGGVGGLRAALDGAWNVTRVLANAALRPAGGGLVVLVGPRPGDGAHAAALGAALENTARTLSIEWARFAIRTVAVLPGDATSADDVATLVAYLASPAGGYFSGCAFTLGPS
jgi:NAD(P)-dependent dehydrogenase (short-subunit alcohol dehydrogenase family)